MHKIANKHTTEENEYKKNIKNKSNWEITKRPK